MIPVRRDVRSTVSNVGSASSAMNIVGTPYREVQRSASTASSVARGSNASLGITMQAPWVTIARLREHHAETVIERHRDANAVRG